MPSPEDDDYLQRADRMDARAAAAYREWFASLPKDEQARLALQGLATPLEDNHRVSGHSPTEERDPAESSLARTQFIDPAALSAPAPPPSFASPIVQRVIGALMIEAAPRSATGALAFALDLHLLNGLGTPRQWAAKNTLKTAPFLRAISQWQKDLELPLPDPAQQRHIQRIVGFLIGENNVKVSCAALAFALNLDALHGIPTLRQWVADNGLSPEALSKKKRWWEKQLDLPPNAFSKTTTAKAALSAAQKTKHFKKATWKAKPKKPA